MYHWTITARGRGTSRYKGTAKKETVRRRSKSIKNVSLCWMYHWTITARGRGTSRYKGTAKKETVRRRSKSINTHHDVAKLGLPYDKSQCYCREWNEIRRTGIQWCSKGQQRFDRLAHMSSNHKVRTTSNTWIPEAQESTIYRCTMV
jgi:hypothetical protein